MAEIKKKIVEREYIIPLRSEWMKVVRYKRSRRSVKEIKKYVAKHMRVPERDVDKVKLDVYLNNEIWFRGAKKPPAKVKVRATQEGDIVRVELVDVPDFVKFAKAKAEKKHKKVDKKKKEVKTEEKKEEKTDQRTEEEKKAEVEKEKAVVESQTKAMEKAARSQKHVIDMSKSPQIHRKSLKK